MATTVRTVQAYCTCHLPVGEYQLVLERTIAQDPTYRELAQQLSLAQFNKPVDYARVYALSAEQNQLVLDILNRLFVNGNGQTRFGKMCCRLALQSPIVNIMTNAGDGRSIINERTYRGDYYETGHSQPLDGLSRPNLNISRPTAFPSLAGVSDGQQQRGSDYNLRGDLVAADIPAAYSAGPAILLGYEALQLPILR